MLMTDPFDNLIYLMPDDEPHWLIHDSAAKLRGHRSTSMPKGQHLLLIIQLLE